MDLVSPKFPFGAAHGLKSWYKTESEDLVHFKETGVTFFQTQICHGSYSGSAMQFGDKLFLFHTLVTFDAEWVRHPYQVGALMDKDGKIEKLTNLD